MITYPHSSKVRGLDTSLPAVLSSCPEYICTSFVQKQKQFDFVGVIIHVEHDVWPQDTHTPRTMVHLDPSVTLEWYRLAEPNIKQCVPGYNTQLFWSQRE